MKKNERVKGMNIKEKLEKEENRLQALKSQKITIEEKIKKTEAEIEKYSNLINQKKFSEMSEVLTANGLTIDEILKAVRSGDMLSLQERIEESVKNKEETVKTEKEELLVN